MRVNDEEKDLEIDARTNVQPKQIKLRLQLKMESQRTRKGFPCDAEHHQKHEQK